jgi:type I restriction enzyme S subunit
MLTPQVTYYRIKDKSKLDASYLKYYFDTNFFQKTIKSWAGSGSTRAYIGITQQLNLPIIYPPVSDQRKIAGVLSILDSKIELNRKVIAELEQMAHTLFNYWFVQFDFPGTDGRPFKSSGGAMVYSPKVKQNIPENWDAVSIYDIATYTNGIAAQKYYAKDGEPRLPIIKIREISNGVTSNTEYATRNVPQKVLVRNGDILFSWSATLEVKLWSDGDGVLNQHIFKVTSDEYPKSFYYLKLLDYLQHFKMMAENRKTTMGHITKDHLTQANIAVPPKNIALLFDKIADPIINRVVRLNVESNELCKIRDWLLPMLMNGQVKVNG